MTRKEKKRKKEPDSPLSGVEPKELPTEKELKGIIRFVFGNCSERDWGKLKKLLGELTFDSRISALTAEQRIEGIEVMHRLGKSVPGHVLTGIYGMIDAMLDDRTIMGEVYDINERLLTKESRGGGRTIETDDTEQDDVIARLTARDTGLVMTDKLEAPVDFDLMLIEYRNKFLKTAEMMEAGGLKHTDELRGAMHKLPKGDEAKEDIREKGKMILVSASLLGTQPPETLGEIINHFDDTLKEWEGETLTLEDLPRIALYCVLSNQAWIIRGIGSGVYDIRERFREVGAKYRKFTEVVSASPLKKGYKAIEKQYQDIIDAIELK